MEKEKYNAYMKNYMRQYRPKQKQTSKRITVSLSPEEYKMLKLKNPKSLAGALKKLAFINFHNRENYPEEVKKSLRELTHILHGIGNNINQIAHYSNSFRAFVEEKELFQQLEKMEFSINKWVSFYQKKANDYQINE